MGLPKRGVAHLALEHAPEPRREMCEILAVPTWQIGRLAQAKRISDMVWRPFTSLWSILRASRHLLRVRVRVRCRDINRARTRTRTQRLGNARQGQPLALRLRLAAEAHDPAQGVQ